MLEIAFTESAGGGLKLAQRFGKGKYHSGCIGVILHHEDGSEPTQEEIAQARQRAEQQHKKAWEKAIPLGGRPGDVYCFSLGLSYGDIRDPMCVEDRLEALKALYGFWDEQIEQDLREQLNKIRSDLNELRDRVRAGEDIRIWYSHIPDELCGFYWLMDELRQLPEKHGTIYAIRQPEYEEKEDSIISYSGWGEVEPGHFGAFTHLAEPVSDQMRRLCGNIWKEIQRENSTIRACINGRLKSAPEDLYDPFIRMELENMPEEFKEGVLIGNILGRHNPGIGDGFLHLRIDRMVRLGELIPLTQAREGEPSYWRMLRKA